LTDAKGLATLQPVRILVDYRPALRERTGVGEFVHELVRAYTSLPDAAGDEVRLFTSSWKDRPAPRLGVELNATVVDRRVPVGLLNYLWHRREWPPIETLAGPVDVVHGQHPLLIPARQAAQVITIHDLFFLSAPERTRGEIRRDYAELARGHAGRADAIVVSSEYTAGQVVERLDVPRDRIHVCPAGAPRWLAQSQHRASTEPAQSRHRAGTEQKYLLFLGTLEPRKNLGVLLDAYGSLLGRGVRVPRLVLAGRATPEAAEWLERARRAPLAGHVEHRGYVATDDRATLYAGARLLVMPSLDEGFGLPVLEAMAAGVPVIASTRGSLPEVAGDAAVLVDATDVPGLATAIERLVHDEAHARDLASRGLARAASFSWTRTAEAVRLAYQDAIARRRERA
jgi:glycosyltransferase involved in cell wall biosynthesis